jgi:hypothetical protein
MTASTSTLELNSEAVAFLEKGMYRDADSVLLRALIDLTETLAQAEHHPGALPMTRPDSDAWRIQPNFLPLVPICVFEQSLTVAESFSPNNAFGFYNKSFLILSLEDYSASTQKQLAAVLWYNWGVSCHLAAILNGSYEFLRRALDNYSKSFKILIQPGAMGNESMRLLLLAVSNNMGYCTSHFSDIITTRGFHEYIQAILSNWRCTAIEYEYFYPTALQDCNTVMSNAPAA